MGHSGSGPAGGPGRAGSPSPRNMARLRENLANKNFLRLWIAQIISQFGDRINQMALIGLIAARSPGSPVGLAKVMSFTIIPVFVVGPVAGVFVDRWDRRVTLFVCDFLRGLLVLTIPFHFIFRESIVPIYIIVFLVFSLSRFYVPAKMSIIPDLVDTDKLLTANSLVTTTGMIAFVMGAAAGGFIVETFGARGGFFWDAATFFISGLLVFSIRFKPRFRIDGRKLVDTGREVITTIRKSLFGEFKDGLKYFIRNPEIRSVASLLFVLFAAAGAVYVVIIVFIQEAFGSVTRDLGLLAVFLGAGLFAGALAYGKWGARLSRFRIIFLCLVSGGLMLNVFALLIQRHPSFFLAAALAFGLGFILGPAFIAANTVVHEVGEAKMLGKVFSSLEMIMHLGFLLTMLLSSYLAEVVSPRAILVGAGTVFAGIGAVSWFVFKGREG